MRSRLGFAMVAAVTIASAPAFSQTNDGPIGTWKGSVERNGAQVPLIVRLAQKGGLWKGRADVDGAASPITKVKVVGSRVQFSVKGQGSFDGKYSGDSFSGSVSGSDKKGRSPTSFTLTRHEESRDAMMAEIEASQVP